MSNNIIIIAEAGVNHNGSLKRALKMVDIAKNCGADIIKFQTFIPNLVASKHSLIADYQKRYQKKNNSQLDLIKKLFLSFNDFKKIKKRCKEKKIEFLSTGFDHKSLAFLKSLNPKDYTEVNKLFVDALMLSLSSKSDDVYEYYKPETEKILKQFKAMSA